MSARREFARDEWAHIVSTVLADQPDLAATTVEAMQAGILEANERLRNRLADVSTGLVEALGTRRGQVRRNRELIITAIEASNVHPTTWSAQAIAKEQT